MQFSPESRGGVQGGKGRTESHSGELTERAALTCLLDDFILAATRLRAALVREPGNGETESPPSQSISSLPDWP